MTKYQLKDMQKFSNCNKLITRGALGSSSHKYRAMEDKWEIDLTELSLMKQNYY